jgi:hypothetical protein
LDLLEFDSNFLSQLLLCCAVHPAAVTDAFSNMNVDRVAHFVFLGMDAN